MTDEPHTVIVPDRCPHGREIRTGVWRRRSGDHWQILGQTKCAKCHAMIHLAYSPQKPTKVLAGGKQLTVSDVSDVP